MRWTSRIVLTLTLTLTGCKSDVEERSRSADHSRGPHPWLVAQPADREMILERIGREPYATVYDRIVAHADEDWREPDPSVWDHSAHGHNGEISAANAFLAWLNQDRERAAKAREGFVRLTDDYETHTTFDINIRMPHSLMGYTDAWDFLSATPWFPEAEQRLAEQKITEINRKFYEQYVEDPFYRGVWLTPSQNNHPIRTAAAIGYVALAFPDHPDAGKWADWAFSELDYLWGPSGQYVQVDGGVSEGPFYYGFAWGVSAALFIAADHVPPPTLSRNCVNRPDVDPWAGHGCVEGERFTFENPLHGEGFRSTVEWSMSIRLPSGQRPPLADAYLNPFNGGSLLTGFGGGGHFTWDWENNVDRPYEMGHGADLSLHHLVHLDDRVEPEEPPWLTRFLPEAGNAVFRSDWTPEARYLLLVAESGAARKTLHDHVDGLSFSMAAYGEYLLVDPGYYKPNPLDNAVTSAPAAHNVVLVDGQGAPPKGLLTDFGDADARLDNFWDGDAIDHAEAHQSYQEHDIVRSVLMVDDRYFIVADRLSTTSEGTHDYTWRLSGYAGYTSGGSFALRTSGASWERELAGVEVYLASTLAGLRVEEPSYAEGQLPHVHQFSLDREVADHAVMDGAVSGSQAGFLAVLSPYRVGDAAGTEHGPLSVTQLDLGQGVAAWRIQGPDRVDDVVVLRDAGGFVDLHLPTGEWMSTDAELALLRLDAGGGFISGGTELTLDGVEVVSGSGPITVAE